jgi:hypothetical protein
MSPGTLRAAKQFSNVILPIMLIALAICSTGCDPVINFYGSYFPAWVVCIVVGIFLAALLRWAFAATGLERHLGSLVIIYPALAFLLSAGVWLLFFGP